MVTSLGAGKSDPKVTSDEHASIVSSAKMHLSIFKAQAIYLRETGTHTKEISEMIRELYASFGDIPVPTPASPPAVEPSPPRLQATCNPPRKILVKMDQVPSNQQQVLARCGDHIIVYAWFYSPTEAVAYNPSNKTTGRIPVTALDMSSDEPYDQGNLCLAKMDEREVSLGHITWKAGDYIKVWGRVNYINPRCAGFGFNIATKQIGKFSTYKEYLETVE